MGFKDYFDIDQVINSYAWSSSQENEGPITGWFLNGHFNNDLAYDVLYLNARKKGQVNLYQQFIEETFFKKLELLLQSKSMSHAIMPLINLYEDRVGNKHIIYDLNAYITALLQAEMLTEGPQELAQYNENITEKIQNYKEILRSERKKLTDILQKKEKSEYFEKFIQIYKKDFKKNNGIINGIPLTPENVLQGKLEFCNKMIMACRHLESTFEKEVELEKLVECFDYDTFCLTLCYSFLEQIVTYENKISYVANYCTNYFKSYEDYKKQNPHYNPKITIYDPEEKKIKRISAAELYEKYKRILAEHPDAHYIDLWDGEVDLDELEEFITTQSEGNEINKKELTKLIQMFFSKQEYEEVTEEEIAQDLQELNETQDAELEEEEKSKVKQQIEKMEFLLENKPIRIIKGTGTFANYYGYVYSNGYVVFDTLNKDLKKSYGNALYVMPYDKMKSFSDIKKRELRANYRGIITPVIHKGNWKERITNILESKPVIDIIEQEEESIDLSKIVSVSQLEELKRIHNDLTQRELDEIEKKKQHIEEMMEIDKELGEETNGELPEEEFDAETKEAAESSESFEEQYERWKKRHPGLKPKRNPIVAGKTKERARDEIGYYCCELCGEEKASKEGRMDCHHVIPLSKGGIDNIYNTVCVCPNCHRDIHEGAVTLAQQYELFKKIKEHLIKNNPEYLPMFEKMLSTVAESEEEYQENHELIDQKFAIMWNGENPKLK